MFCVMCSAFLLRRCDKLQEALLTTRNPWTTRKILLQRCHLLQKRGLDSASCKACYKTKKCSSRQVHFSASQVARKIASCYSAQKLHTINQHPGGNRSNTSLCPHTDYCQYTHNTMSPPNLLSFFSYILRTNNGGERALLFINLCYKGVFHWMLSWSVRGKG